MKKLFVVILDYQNKPALRECLRSVCLNKLPKGWQKKIIVVDNNPQMQMANGKRQNDKLNIKTISPGRNLGFAGGCNVGIKETLSNGAEAILLLNQDAVLEKDCLFWLLDNPADIVAPVIKFRRKGRWVYDYGGKINWRWGKVHHLEFNSYLVNELMGYELDYVSGCAMLIHRPVLEKIGLLDKRYFLYFEDVDFCLRAKKAGFKITAESKALITHHLMEGKAKPFWQRWQLLKSNWLFINRWILWWRRPLAWIYWLFLCIKLLF